MNRSGALGRRLATTMVCVALIVSLSGVPIALAAPSLAVATDNALTWTTGGNASWLGVDSVADSHDSVDHARSGSISHNQTSYMETTVNGPGTLTWWYHTSTETSFDYLRVLDNGAQLRTYSGSSGWTQDSYSVPAGSHTIRFTYDKDGSVSSGADAVYLDQITYTNSPPMGRVDGAHLTDNEVELAPASPEAGAQQGFAVAVSGDTLVSAANWDDTTVADAGSVTVYKRTGGIWASTQLLTAEDEIASAHYGTSVALDGDALAVGCPTREKIYTYYDFGAGFVPWGGPLPAPTANAGFGNSIAISGTTLVVGGYNYDGGTGRVYVYVYDAGWDIQQIIDAPDGAGDEVGNFGDWFGQDVDIDGDRLIVGAPFHDHAGAEGGAAYIYDRVGTTWTLTQEVNSSRGYAAVDSNDYGMGMGVALSGDTAAAGDRTEKTVDVFTLDSTWSRTDQLTRPVAQSLSSFGTRVAMDGNTILVGDAFYDWSTKGGTVFAYARANDVFFDLVETIQPAVGDSSAGFGDGFDIDGAQFVIGSRLRDGGAGSTQGTTYAYGGAYYHVMDGGTLNVPAALGPLANDTDANADTLSLGSYMDPISGGLNLYTDGMFVYDAITSSPAEDSFTYWPSDPHAEGNQTSAYVTIAPPPSGTPVINYGAYYTNNADIDITGSLGNVKQYRTQVDSDGWGEWTRYAGSTIAKALPAIDGEYTVYFDVRGSGGSRSYNADVYLDTVDPDVDRDPIALLCPGDSVHITATDGGSGVKRIGYTVDGGATTYVNDDSAHVTFDAIGSYDVEYWAEDNAGNICGHVAKTFTVCKPAYSAVSVAGTDRFKTAVEVSRKSFPTADSVETVVIATGRNWPDALGGSALAGAYDAPILLCDTHALPATVADEIERLGATNAIILGGEGAVGPEVVTGLVAAGIPSNKIQRFGEANRYATARLIAQMTIKKLGSSYSGDAFVTTGLNYPDALAGSPIAAAKGMPIYLANPSAAPATLASQMDADGVTDAVVLGGTAAVSDSYKSALDAVLGTVDRKSGANRYATGAVVATWGVTREKLAWDNLAIATGENFPDALAGGVLCAQRGSVMLLTDSASLSAPVRDCLTANADTISTVHFLGGTSAVSTGVRDQVANILK